MRSVKIRVSPREMEKANKGQEFLGYPEGTLSVYFEMYVDYDDVIGTAYADNGGFPEAVVCQIKGRQE